MIKISRTTNKEIKEFNRSEWKQADLEHYGKDVDFRPRKTILKAEEDGKTVGVLKMEISAGVTTIDTIIVGKDKRGEGVGKQLVLEAERLAKEKGSHKIYLETGVGWEAMRFYESLGYKKEGVLKKHYVKHDFVAFSKFI